MNFEQVKGSKGTQCVVHLDITFAITVSLIDQKRQH